MVVVGVVSSTSFPINPTVASVNLLMSVPELHRNMLQSAESSDPTEQSLIGQSTMSLL